jgi:ubiquinone/menaquinone biosynthesis C-methylase UbiE
MKNKEQQIQDRVAVHYEELRYRLAHAQHYHSWWIKQMLANAHPACLSGHVLDNGCGIGILAAYLDEARWIIGLDLSLNMLRTAHGSSMHCVQGDSATLPFPDDSFDLILARSVLHHLPDPESGVREMHRVLRPGGQAIFADTNHSLLSSLPRRLAYRSDHFSDTHQNFHRKDYLHWLSTYFELQHVRYFGYLAYPFGFPDMMGPLRTITLPIWMLDILIALDNGLAKIPQLRTQSWGIIVTVTKV